MTERNDELRALRGDASEIFTKFKKKERSRGAIIVAIGLHVLAVLVIGSILLDVPGVNFQQLRAKWGQPTERIQYVRVMPPPAAPAPRVDTGSVRRPARATPEPARPRTGGQPAPPAVPPSSTPTEIGPPSGAQPGGVPGGAGRGGSGGDPNVVGVTPAYADPRLWVPPNPNGPRKTSAERIDSTVRAAFGVYYDSVRTAEANRGKDPQDWTWGKDGNKWGLDPQWVHLGKIKIPTALIGALAPIKQGANAQDMQRLRTATFISQDILYHAQRAQSEDDFRKAVKRIRERKEKERKEQQERRKEPVVP